jgi:hypothetical protein
MKTKAPSPEQWQLLRRLQAAGCPLDLAHLPPPDYPLRVISLNSGLPTNVFPLAGGAGAGIALSLRIVASASITIAGFRLQAEWLAPPLSWVERCPEHPRSYCLLTEGNHTSFDAATTIHSRKLHSGRLQTGKYIQGFLVGTTGAALLSPAIELKATLWIEDVFGAEYPYAVTLNNHPQVPRAASAIEDHA